MNRPLITILLILTTWASLAQGNYTKRNLMQLSPMDFNQYDWKAQKLQKKGERFIVYGAVTGLAGLGIGSLNGGNTGSSDGSDLVFGLAAAMLVGGSLATLAGIPMYFTGIIRCTRINEARRLRNDLAQIQFVPHRQYCCHTQTNYTGISVRLLF